MEVKERREIPIKPVILNLGLAFAVSVGGIVYTYIRIKRTKPKSKPSQSSPGNGSQADSRMEAGELKDDHHALQNSSLGNVSSQNSINGRSSSGERDSLLLPEFNDLVKECNMAVATDDVHPKKNEDSLFLDVDHKRAKHDEHGREIRRLQNMVKTLQEKERNLELKMLEYYGVKEQETSVVELQNQLRLSTMEGKLNSMKIESLLLENRRLEAQVADHTNAATELEAAKAKIKMLRKKLKAEAERNREQTLKLHDQVKKLHEHEQKAAEIDQELKMQQQEHEELKMELAEMKRWNQSLNSENSDFAQKLEYIKVIATSAINSEEVQELKEEGRRLKQQNEDLRKEMERLQADRRADLEELVYLRWMNACLRRELRIHRPGDGKNIPRDLSKRLSPKTEYKAKKLILEYANKEGGGEKGMMDANYMGSERWSPSQASCLTDERDELPGDSPADNKTRKTKLFAKLRKLILGKGSSGRSRGPASPLKRTASLDELPAIYPSEFHSGFSLDVDGGNDDLMKASRTSSAASSRRSLDIPRSYSRGTTSITRENSNCSSSTLTNIDLLAEYENGWSPAVIQPHQDSANAVKEELLNFAEALKNSKSCRSSVSSETG